jgi:hypothetical protein
MEIEREFARLHQELLKLKDVGVRPKKEKIFMTDVNNVAMSVGMARLRTLSYLEYLKICVEMRGNVKNTE